MTDTTRSHARHPGPSTPDLFRADPSGVPPVWLTESMPDLGAAPVPFEHYTSAERAELEQDHLWGRVWQWACHETHVQEVGDYHVYDIGDRSAIIVRTDSGLRGFLNVCQHRGTQLKPPGSCGFTAQLRCPFHGWTWNLDGSLAEIPCQWDFPQVRPETHALPEVQVDTWGGFVFVNFDPDAGPLADHIGILPEHFAHTDFSDRVVEAHVVKRLPANWKAAQEAFLEAYHVLETHPQSRWNASDANASYDIYGPNVSRFIHLNGWPSPHLDPQPTQDEVLARIMARKAEGVTPPPIPEGDHARDVYARFVQQEFGERYGRDFSHLSTSETIDSVEYGLFPNGCFFPTLQISMAYRFRPDPLDVNASIYDVYILAPAPADGERPQPPEPVHLGVDDSFTTVPGVSKSIGIVLDQDTANLAAQARGMRAAVRDGRTTGESLGVYQEARIRHFHATIEEYIQRGLARAG
jgi:phenylpropionate dioxygenase-like ring-hydroxylating dioxygenase large terminal subunit